MDTVLELFNIDWKTVVVGIIVILFAVVALVQVIGKFSEIIGKPLKWVQKNNKDHETLERLITVVDGLEKKHAADTEAFTAYNANFEQKFEDFMNEMRGQMQGYLDARIHDREQSRQIQKELNDTIALIRTNDKQRDVQIEALMVATKEQLAEKINEKYKYYLSIKGIPEDEYDEFISLHDAYKGCHGNHLGDRKFNYCMEHLPVIPGIRKLEEN